MSTPRPSTQCFAGNHSECTETMDTCNCTYRGGHKTSHAYANIEGVAAPLEPTRLTPEEANQLELLINEIGDAYSIGATSHYSLLDDAPGEGSLADGILRAFNLGRAAVSKNLQEERCPKCEDPNNLGHYPCVRLTPRSELMALIDKFRISRDAERSESANLRAEISELKDKLREKEITALRETK